MTDLNYENSRFLDIVNENDEVIDSGSRTDIHRLGLPHREVHVWMFDKNKNIFFQKRGLHTKSAGLLDATIGGHVNKGEDYLAAAIRETKEETNILVSSSDLAFLKKVKALELPKENFEDNTNNFMRSVYIYKKPIDEKMLKKEEGIPGGGFKTFSYQFLLNLAPEYRKTFINFVLTQELPYVLEYLHTWKS